MRKIASCSYATPPDKIAGSRRNGISPTTTMPSSFRIEPKPRSLPQNRVNAKRAAAAVAAERIAPDGIELLSSSGAISLPHHPLVDLAIGNEGSHGTVQTSPSDCAFSHASRKCLKWRSIASERENDLLRLNFDERK